MSAPSAPGAVEAARATYGAVAEIVWSGPERRTRMLLAAENRNLHRDMTTAETLAGKRPRIASREFPLA